jgi:hypothetical protein
LQLYDAIEADLGHLEAAIERLRSSFSIELRERSITDLFTEIAVLFDRRTEIYDAIALRQWQTTLDDFGLANFTTSAFKANISPDHMPRLFEAYSARRRVDQIRRETPALKKYNGGIIEAYRTAFADRDRAKQKDDCATLRSPTRAIGLLRFHTISAPAQTRLRRIDISAQFAR